MKNSFRTLAVVICTCLFRLFLAPGSAAAQTIFDRIDPSLAVLPEYPLAKPLSGGPLRIVFIGETGMTGLVCPGVVSRLECTFESVLTPSRNVFSPAGESTAAGSRSTGDLVSRAEEILGTTCDAIWLDFRFADLPVRVRDRILERVQSGAGLIYTGPGRELTKIVDVKKDGERADAGVYGDLRADRVGFLGRGRVFAIPELGRDADALTTGDWWSLAAGVFILASGRNTDITLHGVKTSRRPIEHESMSIMNFRVYFGNSGSEVTRKIRSLFRNDRGEKAAVVEDSYLLKNGEGFFSVRYPLLPAGNYSVDVAVLGDGKTIAVSGASFSVYSDDGLAGMNITKQFAGEGEFISGRVRMKNEIHEGMALNLDLYDSWGHRTSSTELIPDPRRLGVDFVFGIRKASRGVMTVRANLYKNNLLSDTREKSLWASGSYNPERFAVAILDTVPYEKRYTPVFEHLADLGTEFFALDMTRSTSGEAQAVSAAVSKKGATAVPLLDAAVFGSDVGAGRRSVSIGKALLDTLSLMDTPSFIVYNGLMPSGALRPSSIFGSISVKPDSLIRFSLLSPVVDGGYATIVPLPGQKTRSISGFVLGAEDRIKESVVRAAPWQSLFSGMNSVWWVGAYRGQEAAMAPGLIPNPRFVAFVEEAHAIAGGIDHLVYGSACLSDTGAILFGRSFFMTGEKRGNTADPTGAKGAVSVGGPVVTLSDSSGKIVKGIKTVLFRDGAAFYVGVLADPSLEPSALPSRVILRVRGLEGEYHLYDIRDRAYRSGMKETTFAVMPGGACLFALLPYKVRDVELKVDAPVISPGNSFSCQATITTQDGRIPGRHVLSVDVMGPDGVSRAWLSDVLETHDGSVKISIPVSTGDAPGKWILRIRDVASGKQSERAFIVMPPTGG